MPHTQAILMLEKRAHTYTHTHTCHTQAILMLEKRAHAHTYIYNPHIYIHTHAYKQFLHWKTVHTHIPRT